MNQNAAIVVTCIILFVAAVSWLWTSDHRHDRNVPGATTTEGKRSLGD